MSYNSDTHLVVIPTYNEIDNIEEFIYQISKIDVSVLIVDDNSPDGTWKTVKDISSNNNQIYLLKQHPNPLLTDALILFLQLVYEDTTTAQIVVAY